MSSELFSSLLYVTAAQVLRTAGFDRARPSLIELIADIIARYLTTLGKKSMEFASLRNRQVAELPDVRAALECLDLLPTDIFSSDLERLEGTATIDEFLKWSQGNKAQELRRVAGMEGHELFGLSEGSDHLLPSQGSRDWFASM